MIETFEPAIAASRSGRRQRIRRRPHFAPKGSLAASILVAASATLVSCTGRDVPPALEAGTPQRPPARVVAIGDLHGNLDVARRALRLAGAIDADDAWVGGTLIVVQTGDQIDRGDDDRAVLDLFDALAPQAAAVGGRAISLVGNHETKNVEGRLDYVAPAGFTAFCGFCDAAAGAPDAAQFSAESCGRRAAFRPGGPYATLLSRRPIFAVVERSLFVHGGITPGQAERGIDSLNELARDWMDGPVAEMPASLQGSDSPLWDRTYSTSPGAEACATLGRMLAELHVDRLVVGHGIQSSGINSACGGKVWRIDTGMGMAQAGPVEVLEIREGRVRVIQAR
jgi:hypothetical protein